MSDFSLPTDSSLYTDVLPKLLDRDTAAITLCSTVPSNIPTHSIRWNRSSKKFQEWDGAAWQDLVLDITGGGTGAITAALARTALGLGTLSTQNANAVAITAGAITASGVLSGLVDQANLGSGSDASGNHFLADDQTWKSLASAFTSGMMMIYAGASSSVPSGWLLCDGSSLLRAGTYAALFAIIGTTYGSVDGTHFTLPDMRQRFPLGKAASGTGSTLGATGGAIDHTHTSAAHTHTVAGHTHTGPSHTHTVPGLSVPGLDVSGLGLSVTGTSDGASNGHTHTYSGTTSGASTVGLQASGSSTTFDATPDHTHTFSGTTSDESADHTHHINISGSTGPGQSTGTGTTGTGTSGASGTGATSSTSLTSDSTTPGATGTNNAPFLAVNYIIKV